MYPRVIWVRRRNAGSSKRSASIATGPEDPPHNTLEQKEERAGRHNTHPCEGHGQAERVAVLPLQLRSEHFAVEQEPDGGALRSRKERAKAGAGGESI